MDDCKWKEVDELIKRQQTPAEFIESTIRLRGKQQERKTS